MENERYRELLERLRPISKAAIAFSGGTDSTLLLAAARDALGAENVLALTAVSSYMDRQEIVDALALSSQLGVRHELVELGMPEGIETNPSDRCYICKRALYMRLSTAANQAGFSSLLDGSNLDDLSDYRPGLRALRELKIDSPLLELRIDKAEVRRLSCELGLSTWNKPTNACLLTRLPVDTRVAMEDLQRIEEAERFLRGRGYQWVRVRLHGTLARIEVSPDQRYRLLEEAETVTSALVDLGFRHVSMDLMGYRLGSMNPAFK
jgi:uncharacterized protein